MSSEAPISGSAYRNCRTSTASAESGFFRDRLKIGSFAVLLVAPGRSRQPNDGKDMYDRINALITTQGFSFQSWDDRYSKGVWVALAPSENALDVVRDSTSAGDLDMIPATEYFSSTEWLPIVAGDTFIEALGNLEQRLSALPPEMLSSTSIWATAVYDALDHLRDIQRLHSGYGATDGHFRQLPNTFKELMAAGGVSGTVDANG